MSADISDKFDCRLILFPFADDGDDVMMMIVVVVVLAAAAAAAALTWAVHFLPPLSLLARSGHRKSVVVIFAQVSIA